MNPHPLDYLPTTAQRPSFRVSRRLIIPVAALLALYVGASMAGRQDVRSRVDAVTGSMEWQTTWPLGFTRGPSVQVSPLEARLTQAGIPWSRDWRLLHITHRSLLGRQGYSCGLAPPIYDLRPVLPEFVAASTDAELQDFVRVMQSGTEAEQEAAVRAAIDRVLNPPPPPAQDGAGGS